MHKFFRACGLLLVLAISAFFPFSVNANQHLEAKITLQRPVQLSAEEQLFVSALPTLTVASHKQAPPLSLYDRHADKYTGISVDLFCFVLLPTKLVCPISLSVVDMYRLAKRWVILKRVMLTY